MRRFFALLLVFVLLLTGCGTGKEVTPVSAASVPEPSSQGGTAAPEASSSSSSSPGSPQPEEPLLSTLTDRELLGQLMIIGFEPEDDLPALAEELSPSGVIFYAKNLPDDEAGRAAVQALQSVSLPLPLFLAVDEEGGKVSRLPSLVGRSPSARSIGESKDPQKAFDHGAAVGRSMGALGLNLDFAPVLDVDSNPQNPVIGSRSFSSNPDEVARMGLAMAAGLRSEGIIAAGKHFPGHGDTATDSHTELPVVDKSPEELWQTELIPFARAAEEGIPMLMIAHILLPQLDAEEPATLSSAILQGLLRKELSYDGVIITDDITMGAVSGRYSPGEAAVKAISAGADMVLVGHGAENARQALTALEAALENGSLPRSRVEESFLRVLALKKEYLLP